MGIWNLRTIRKTAVIIGVMFLLPFVVVSQTVDSPEGNSVSVEEIPLGFRSLKLGLNIEEVKEILYIDPYFDYRGDPDVSLLPQENQSLIECSGNLYIERSYMQFYDERLFIIILELNEIQLDYYTIFSTLSAKYGEPTYLNPLEVVWIFEEVKMSLEKPLSLKYLDRVIFEKLNQAGSNIDNLMELSKEAFLDEL